MVHGSLLLCTTIGVKVRKMSVSTEKEFFKGKRPWSKIKDQILSKYMRPYLLKVSKLGKPIILIDAFAGPGKFEDGSAGSPLILCQAAQKHLKNQEYLTIFVNQEATHHEKLSYVLSSFDNVITIFGNAEKFLAKVQNILKDHTVFLYLDPFGLKGCELSSVIKPFLQRNQAYSTEIVVNLSIQTVHRFAAHKAVYKGKSNDPLIRSRHAQLTKALGGDYWKNILLSNNPKTPEEKAEEIMARYRKNILNLGSKEAFSGYCPVREKESSAIKYYVTFYSRHEDAMILMNDIMCDTYNCQMHESWKHGTLFENLDWREFRSSQQLEEIILETLYKTPCESRRNLWVKIVKRNFMRFTRTEYKKIVKKLKDENKINFVDIRGTGKLNDDSKLYIPD